MHRHTQDTIVILEEGNGQYPRRPQCDMFVSHKALNDRQLMPDFYRRGAERKWNFLAEEEARAGAEAVFTAAAFSV